MDAILGCGFCPLIYLVENPGGVDVDVDVDAVAVAVIDAVGR